ncbi:hypothetical protein BC833DRAFT_610467 [Globomyces pollinis-pini]|nr:hypothetical protein BC833DRAFT_610467 [Globomyces pollinis-pini]
MDFLGDDLGLNQESNSKCDISEPSGEEKSDKALDDSKPIAPEPSIIQAVNEVPIAPAAFEPDELIKNPIPIQAAADSQGIVSVLEKESSTTYASTVNVLDSVIIKEQYFILENLEEPKEFNESVDYDQLLIAESEIIFTHPIATCTSSETVVDKVNSQVEDTSDKIPKLPKNCNSNDKIPIQALIKIISDHYRKMLDSHVPLEQWLKNLSTDSW